MHISKGFVNMAGSTTSQIPVAETELNLWIYELHVVVE